MKITRDDIKEMVINSVNLLTEKNADLTKLFQQNHDKIASGNFSFQDVDTTEFKTSDSDFIKQLRAYRKKHNIPTANRIQQAKQREELKQQNIEKKLANKNNKVYPTLDTFDAESIKNALQNKISQQSIVNAYFFKNPTHIFEKNPLEIAEFLLQIGLRQYNNEIERRDVIKNISETIKQLTYTYRLCVRYFRVNPNGINEDIDTIYNNINYKSLKPSLIGPSKIIYKTLVANNIDADPYLTLEMWFKNNGGNSIDINEYSYPKQICDLAYACPLQIKGDIFKNIETKKLTQPFFDFFHLIWLKNSRTKRELIDNLSSDYLKYLAYKKILSKNQNLELISIPSELENEENIKRFYEDYGGSAKNFKAGDQKGNKTKKFCEDLLLELGIKKNVDINHQSTMLLFNKLKEAGGYDFLVDKTSKILQQNANVYSRLITDNKLYELLWIMFYIITNRMFSLLDKFYEKIPNNLYEEFPQIIRMAFGVKYYMMYGQNYLKLDRLIDENDASLFNPYSNYSLNNEYICGILRNCIDLNIPQLNIKMGLPIEQIIEYWGNCYSFMTLTNTEKYGGDMVLTWENLLNPYFSAEEAMERAGIDKFAKGKFKKSNKRGEIVNLSFYDFMMWDVKIKEKTQKEIYFFLANNTTVPWKYEYNRYDKQADEELGKKSIDIFNENYGICIEYQGEQHFRPFGVKGDDDDSIEMVLLGFKEKGVGPISTLKNELIERIVLGETPDKLETLIKDRLIQMCKKYINVPIFKEAYDAFQQGKDTYNIKTIKGDNDNHYIRRVISVKRFLDEINVIKQKKRDEIKVEAVRNKNWDMLYVLPGKKNAVTNDDMEMIIKLVGDNHFFWKQDEEKLLNYLSYRYNIVKQINNNTLFEQIVKELLK